MLFSFQLSPPPNMTGEGDPETDLNNGPLSTLTFL